MCVAVSVGPAEVLELDAPMFDALELEAAAANGWSPELELAATAAELQSAHLLAYLSVHSKRGAQLPKPLRIPRPPRGDATSASSSTSSSTPAKQGAASFAARFLNTVVPAAPAGEV